MGKEGGGGEDETNKKIIECIGTFLRRQQMNEQKMYG